LFLSIVTSHSPSKLFHFSRLADIQLSQFLLAENGMLKLNDFNRAEIMLFNEKDKEYCRYRNNPGHGDVSSEVVLVAVFTFDSMISQQGL